jgi:hypothetical protein
VRVPDIDAGELIGTYRANHSTTVDKLRASR